MFFFLLLLLLEFLLIEVYLLILFRDYSILKISRHCSLYFYTLQFIEQNIYLKKIQQEKVDNFANLRIEYCKDRGLLTRLIVLLLI